MGEARHPTIHHVKEARGQDDQAGREKTPFPEQHRGHDIEREAQGRQRVGVDPGERKSAHNGIEKELRCRADQRGARSHLLPQLRQPADPGFCFEVHSLCCHR